MKRVVLSLISILFLTKQSQSQSLIDIAENTLKVAAASEEVFYYGFAEGDQLVFNFEEINGKELKEVEITALPSKSVFMDYKTKKISNKILTIPETGIYKFRFTNSNILSGRICKFKVQRVPVGDNTLKFNTTVFKRIIFDTSYYDSQETFLVRADTTVSEIVSQTAKVHSKMNVNGNITTTNFNLPKNTVSWSYYIGVDQGGQQVYQNATSQLIKTSSPLLGKLIGSNPLAALTLGFTSYLLQLNTGEDIDFYLIDSKELSLFKSGQQFRYYKTGKVINTFAKMDPIPANLSFCFSNDNELTPVSVLLKITAVEVNAIYDTRQVKRMNISSREELYLKN